MSRTVEAGPPADGTAAPGRARAGRAWIRRGLAVVLLGVAAYEAYQRHGEIARAGHLVTHLRPAWLVLAVAAEAGSMVAFARLQRWLLQAGGVEIGLGEMTEITLAGNALGTSLPGGAAWAATWAFGQLRRRGADRILAGWVILVAGALSSFALFVLVASGAFIAGSKGPVASLRWVAGALAAIPVVAGTGLVASRRSPAVRRTLHRVWRGLDGRVPLMDRIGRLTAHVVERLRTVRPGGWGWTEAFGLALANWLYNAGCLLACMEALHVPVPWRGLLVVYSLTQISASLPITPGGIGVVEGSMSALLVAYGVPMDEALATVLLYRVVSFWGLVPVGWGVWFWLEASSRRGRRASHPWSIHVHARGDRPTRALGPERLVETEPCAGCPEATETGRRRRRAA